jgi:hypothetical protein
MSGVVTPRAVQNPDFWRVYGHSWFNFQTGPSGDQTGRVDSLVRGALDIEWGHWRNYAINGAQATRSGRSTGGWARVLNRSAPPLQSSGARRVAPYAPDSGGTLVCYGINDMGIYGGNLAAVQESYVDAMRAIISRSRASAAFPVTDSAFAYGAGFTSNAAGLDLGQATTDRMATTTTSATITFTIPADYTGETIAFGFLKRPDQTGGVVTFSGTAGVTGTFDTQNVQGGIPAAQFNNSYTVKRLTQLTSANAGQTIIMTLTTLDASGTVFFDGAWFESETPGAVIVINIAKSYASAGVGYYLSTYNTWSSTGTRSEANMDSDVATTNAALATMVGEFDSMVQIADVQELIKSPLLTSDGIHPNERGAAPIVDAIIAARDRLAPAPTAWGRSLSYNTPAPRAAQIRRPRTTAGSAWYGSDFTTPSGTGLAVPASGTLWAVPFVVTEAREIFTQIGIDVVAAGTVAPVIRWGVYDDPDWSGYPGEIIALTNATTTTAKTMALATGLQSSTFIFQWPVDPGLFWLAIKSDTQGTGQTWRAQTGQSPFMPQRATGVGTNLNCGWQVTGQGTTDLIGTFPTGATLIQTAPLIQLLKVK